MRYKYAKLRSLHGKGSGDGSRGRIGIPFGLQCFKQAKLALLPFGAVVRGK